MALGDAYVATGELKAYAQIDDTVDDIQIGAVVSAVSSAVERYCGRTFNDAGSPSAREYTPETLHTLKVADFSTVTGLVVKSDTGGDGTFATTLDATSYFALPRDGIVDGQTGHPFRKLCLRTGWFIVNGEPTVQVTAQWGWTAVPKDVKQAVMIQAARVFGRRYSVNGVIGQGDFAFRVSSRMDPDVQEMLNPYQTQVLVA